MFGMTHTWLWQPSAFVLQTTAFPFRLYWSHTPGKQPVNDGLSMGGEATEHQNEMFQILMATRPMRAHLGQGRHEGVDVGLPGGRYDLLHAGLCRIVPVPDVLPNGSVEEDRLLRHDADLGPDMGKVELLDVMVLKVK